MKHPIIYFSSTNLFISTLFSNNLNIRSHLTPVPYNCTI
jgi:hypothetical protein